MVNEGCFTLLKGESNNGERRVNHTYEGESYINPRKFKKLSNVCEINLKNECQRVRLKYNQFLKGSNTKLRFYHIDMCIQPELTKVENLTIRVD